MTLTLTLIFFLFGLIIGSFLNVVIYRYNTKSFGGRSCCLSCNTQLCWPELIPVISFLSLGGKCRNCDSKISLQYPLVELVTGTIFGLLFWKFQDVFYADTLVFTGTYAYYAAVFSLLLVIAVYDLKHKIIPDKLALFLGIVAFFGLFFFSDSVFPVFSPHIPSIMEFLSGIFFALPFAFLWLVSSGRWMGLGDAKLAVGLGWLLGVSRVLPAVLFSFWSGAIVGIVLIIFSKKYRLRSEIPFAPFLALGTFLAFLLPFYILPIGFSGF